MKQQITFTSKQLEDGATVMVNALDIGENGTRGDYTEYGLLHKMFEALEIAVVEAPVTSVGSD